VSSSSTVGHIPLISAQGATGPEGPARPPGYSVLHANGAPFGIGDGEDNDFDIDTASIQLYGSQKRKSLTGSGERASARRAHFENERKGQK
jgi:hypothetical protein